jgi:signal recognition particle subunit SRP54
MMGLPGRRSATKSPKNKRKGTKGSTSAGRRALPMGGMPSLPPGFDPSALEQGQDGLQGLPPGFKLPKLDFGRLTRKDKNS